MSWSYLARRINSGSISADQNSHDSLFSTPYTMWIFKEILAIAASQPWLLFLAIAFLPGFGFPVSLLFAAAGMVWGTSLSSCSIVIAALAVNLTWTYWLTRSPVGDWIRSKLPAKWLKFLDTEPCVWLFLENVI